MLETTDSASVKSFTVRFPGLARQILVGGITVGAAYEQEPEADATFVELTALWDTGATNTVISHDVVKRLGLFSIGTVPTIHAGGIGRAHKYMVSLILPKGIEFPALKVTDAPLIGFDMLIGMDIITQGDFSLSEQNGTTCFSFRVPSLAEMDFTHSE
ncbi:MAG: retroviral-like aspartic protease family protein [Coriobacteriales bacterium]|jgi:hypothetical protein|nr:retroviral-like aspartic protease family protein [Coriobacteriales bacterium]